MARKIEMFGSYSELVKRGLLIPEGSTLLNTSCMVPPDIIESKGALKKGLEIFCLESKMEEKKFGNLNSFDLLESDTLEFLNGTDLQESHYGKENILANIENSIKKGKNLFKKNIPFSRKSETSKKLKGSQKSNKLALRMETENDILASRKKNEKGLVLEREILYLQAQIEAAENRIKAKEELY